MTVSGAKVVNEIPGKMTSYWHPKAKAVVDCWTSYDVTLDEFRIAVLEKGLAFSKANGGHAWVVDSHTATGSLTPS